MVVQKTAQGDVPVRQVNNILQNLRGEDFRHARNVQGKRVSTSLHSSHAHSQPTLPIDLIYPSPVSPPPIPPSRTRAPGPSPPKSWRSPATPIIPANNHADVPSNTPAWRERALSLLFSTDAPSWSSSASARPIYPDPSPIPSLTLVCLQLLRATCAGADLARIVPYIPQHLRRTLARYAAVHVPLSPIELDALRQGTTHIDTELVVVGPGHALRGNFFQKHLDADARRDDLHVDGDPNADSSANAVDRDGDGDAWDAALPQDSEPLSLRSLAVLSIQLSAATLLAFPPTITRLALINLPHRIPLQRLPTICPLLVFLDLSYNMWLCADHAVGAARRGPPMLEEMEWGKLRRLEVVGLRRCPVTPKVLLELSRGRWEDVQVIQ